MSRALQLTGADLVRAIGNAAALPAVDAAVARRAAAVAAELAAAGTGTEVLKHGDSDYVVTVTGADVFAREFGAVGTPGAPFVAAALQRAGKP
jgi:hypothetical protein